jgi:LacI family transcriptional regulator
MKDIHSRITAVDIARHVGLAPTTVSHVLAGRAGRVRIKVETQERVLQAAQELGYRTNTSARAMRTGHFGCAALIQPLRHMYLAPELLLGLSLGLEAANMHLSVAHVADEAFGDNEYLPKIVRELAADGLFINAAFDFPKGFLEAVEAHHIPTLWINQKRAADCIFPDDFAGGVQAAEHLIAMGHRRVAFVVANPTDRHYSVLDRRAGYESAMREAGLEPQVCSLMDVEAYTSGDLRDRRIERAAQLLSGPDRPTAILAYEFDTALPVIVAAGNAGLQIPKDLSVAMFHSKIEYYTGLGITTVVVSWEIGRDSVLALRTKIDGPQTPLPPLAVLPSLHQGNTCAPPKMA